MRPSCSPALNLTAIVRTLVLIALLCPLFHPDPALSAGNPPRSTVRLDDFRGASPRKALMPQGKSVLRLVVSRKPVAACLYPEREDALNFLNAYVVETLECGHSVEMFFNPPVEALIAKRRRCMRCHPNVIEFPARDQTAPQRKAA